MLLPMILALAAPQDLLSPDAADLRCMALFSAATPSASKDEQAGLIAGTMFFYGKITGRSPKLDVEAGMIELFKSDPEGKQLELHRARCAKEMEAHGVYLTAMGQHLVARANGQ